MEESVDVSSQIDWSDNARSSDWSGSQRKEQ